MNIEIIIAVVIAVAGWIFTHWLTIRAQNKAFLNQIINDARIEIARAIRNYQHWLGTVETGIHSLRYDVIRQEYGGSVDWLQKIAELVELFFRDKSPVEWILRLEEHEILFPKTAKCRKDLADRQHQINEYFRSFVEELQSGLRKSSDFDQCKRAIQKAQKNEILTDQLCLMQDLLIYLQNFCLSSFTGSKIPERKPEDLSLPRLVQDESGNLQIVVPQNTTKNDGS